MQGGVGALNSSFGSVGFDCPDSFELKPNFLLKSEQSQSGHSHVAHFVHTEKSIQSKLSHILLEIPSVYIDDFIKEHP